MAATLGSLLPRQRTGHIYLAIAVGVAAVSAIAAIRGQIGWGLTEGSLCIVVVLYLLPWLTPRRRECVQVDDTGVIVLADQGRDEVRWDAVTQIRIMTTAGGPSAEDVYFVLDAEGGKGCVVPHDAVVRTKLLEEIQTRFRGVDDRKVIEAMMGAQAGTCSSSGTRTGTRLSQLMTSICSSISLREISASTFPGVSGRSSS